MTIDLRYVFAFLLTVWLCLICGIPLWYTIPAFILALIINKLLDMI